MPLRLPFPTKGLTSPCVPPFHVNGAVWTGGKREGIGLGATGREGGGAGGKREGGGIRCNGGEGERGGGCAYLHVPPSVRMAQAGGEREGGNVPLCPPAPPFSVQRGGSQCGDRGKGRGKRREEGGEGGGGRRRRREGGFPVLFAHPIPYKLGGTQQDGGGWGRAMGGKSLGG
ncbi:hypothetical protein H4582DRAFT_2059151 [Lactarius indigo]|nr:hypothetical protein H4582DRAFT_2059151 [Lactarius indigo]